MKVREKIKELHEKQEFKEWETKNKDSFLSFIMRVIENPPNDEYQIGYYNKKTENITTFILNNGKVIVNLDEEVFKKKEDVVNELMLEKVKHSLTDAAKLAKNFQQDKYPTEKPIKIISILQNLPNFGNIWNITFISQSFNTLNIKLSAENGEILKHSLSKLFDFT